MSDRPANIPDRGPRAKKDPVAAARWCNARVDALIAERDALRARVALLEARLGKRADDLCPKCGLEVLRRDGCECVTEPPGSSRPASR